RHRGTPAAGAVLLAAGPRRASQECDPMSVIVGYVPTSEGRAALRYAVRECLMRESPLVVVQSPRRSESGAEEFAGDVDGARRELEAAGLAVVVTPGSDDGEPADDLIAAAAGGPEDLIV